MSKINYKKFVYIFVVTVWTIVSIIIIMQYSVIFNSLCISLEYFLACLLYVLSMCYPLVFSLYISSASQLLSFVVKFIIISIIEFVHKIPRVTTIL